MIKNDSSLNASKIHSFFDNFVQDKLGLYLDRVALRLRNKSIRMDLKEFNNSLRQTVVLEPLEYLILDSPLIQRLRKIRQLGTAHWTYDGALHTRFDHSIGVVHQAQRLMDAYTSQSYSLENATGHSNLNPNKIEFTKSQRTVIRLAALLHDVGHGCFSHVSEHSLSSIPAFQIFLQDFKSKNPDLLMGTDDTKLYELFSYLIVTSDAFMSFLKGLVKIITDSEFKHWMPSDFSHEDEIERLVESVSKLIIGCPIDYEWPYIQEIISGPYDADKLDYMQRDSYFCGIPYIVDTSRLLSKLVLVKTKSENIPGLHGLSQPSKMVNVFALKKSGEHILSEIATMRAFLYRKIYKHHKVLAIEYALNSLFKSVYRKYGIEGVLNAAFCLSDEYIANVSFEKYMKEKNISVRGRSGRSTNLVIKYIQYSVDARDTYLAALSFGGNLSIANGKSEELRSFVSSLRGASMREKFKSEIVNFAVKRIAEFQRTEDLFEGTELKHVVETMDEETKLKFLNEFIKNTVEVGIEIDESADVHLGNTLILVTEKDTAGDSIIRKRNDIDIGAANSAENVASLPVVMIFCPREIAHYIYIIADIIMYKKYKVKIPEYSFSTKVPKVRIKAAQNHLTAWSSWYRGVPFIYRPLPVRLAKEDVGKRLDKVVRKFQGYDAPVTKDLGEFDLKTRLIVWLSQWKQEELIEGAITVLEHVMHIGREEIVAGISGFVEKYENLDDLIICPLGSAKDSGAISAYYVGDRGVSVKTLGEAVSDQSKRPIVFVDDFCGSGHQLVDIVGNYFGVERIELEAHLGLRNLNEERDSIDRDTVEILRERVLGVHFTASWNEGREIFTKFCNYIGKNIVFDNYISEKKIPFIDEVRCLAGEKNTNVKKFISESGRIVSELYESVGKAENDVADKIHGHGNRGMLMVTNINTPAQSLASLYLTGKYDGTEWLPAFPRRKKK